MIEGEEAAYSGSGTVDGAAYQFSVTPSSADTWDIVGEAGSGIHSRTVTVELRRAAGDPDPDPDVAYVLWADEIEVNNVSGSLSGQAQDSSGLSGSLSRQGSRPAAVWLCCK